MMGVTTWESWYGHPESQSVKYKRSIVSYLDILGFRELVQTRTAGEISRILRILAESISPHPKDEPAAIEFTKFSDTIIRSSPEPNPVFFIYELKNILRAQVALIPEEVTIRGVVTIGDIVQSWGVVYGPAVVRAYELESLKGGPPRIIIDDEALGLLEPAADKEKLLSASPVRMEGSTIYLDYLGGCEIEFRDEDAEYPRFLEIHRDFIRRNLAKYADKPDVFLKYQWLRNYHENILKEKFGLDAPSHLSV
jgi:hypothetical protein